MQVNSYFMCDAGRLSYREENEAIQSSKYSVQSLKQLMINDEGKKIMLANADLSLENLITLKIFCAKHDIELFALPHLDKDFGDTWLRSSMRSANAKALKYLDICSDSALYEKSYYNAHLIININHPSLFNSSDEQKKVLQFHTHHFENEDHYRNRVAFASYSHENGTLINGDDILQRFYASNHEIHNENSLINIFCAIDGSLHPTQERIWSQDLTPLLGIKLEEIATQGSVLKGENHA